MSTLRITVAENVRMYTTYEVDADELSPEDLERITERYVGFREVEDEDHFDGEDRAIVGVIDRHPDIGVEFGDVDEREITYMVNEVGP